MLAPSVPEDEALRLRTLRKLKILDTDPEERFDRLTRLAQQLLHVPIALVSLVDTNRQWFKSCQGLDATETSRSISFCGHAILEDKIFVIEDTLCDPRFADNPLVTGEPHIRFYAGQPLKALNGSRVGTLCVIDTKPHHLSQVELDGLQDLAILVERELNNMERQEAANSLLSSENRLNGILNNVLDGIITIGERGEIEQFNPAARRIFGYSDAEVIGQNVKMLMPEPYHSEHDGYLDHYISTGEKKVIGIGREVTGRRKDGSTFPMELAVSAVEIDGSRHFVGITRDITERKRIEQIQKEFISTVSHELRTPLTSIRGALGLVLGGVAGELPKEVQSLLTIANNNSERLIHLINDILDMEKISAGKMLFDNKVMNLIPVVQQAIDSNRAYAEQFNVHLELKTGHDDLLMVRIDEKRMAQVMSNLLSNAAKYSPTHDLVEITVKTSKESVRISVHDNGKGIPEEFRPRIFSKFAQADSSDTRQKGGTGLGLNITKSIVEKMNGSIGFESSEAAGTTFYVDLPIYHEPHQVELSQLIESNPAISENAPLVLIVEDDRDVSKLLGIMLENEGYRFHQAYDYQQAVEHLQNYKYRIVTLDLMIPGGSGVTLLQDLRKNPATVNLPVIVVSAKAAEGRLEIEGQAFSVVDWIDKPIDEKRLQRSIRSGLLNAKTHGGRLLHVEDDPDIAMIVDTLLSKELQVVHAVTLQQAKQRINSEAFDLVLLDIGLPDGSGLELLPVINSQPHPAQVVIFSAQDISPNIAATVQGILLKSKTDNKMLMQLIKSTINDKR